MNIIWWYHILGQKQTIPWCSHKRSCQQNWLLKIQISTVVVPQNQNSEYLRLHIVELHINQVDIGQFIEYPKTWMMLNFHCKTSSRPIFFRGIHFVEWASQESRQLYLGLSQNWIPMDTPNIIQLFVIIVPICSNIFVASSGLYPMFRHFCPRPPKDIP